MEKVKMLTAVLVTCVVVSFGFAQSAFAADQSTLTDMFDGYEETMENYAKALLSKDWAKTKKSAQELVKRSEEFDNLAKSENNKHWLFETGGMIRHSEELAELADKKDALDSVFVLAASVVHLQHVKGASPHWAISRIGDSIEELSGALNKKDVARSAELGKIIHMAGGQMALAGKVMSGTFANTRWVKDAQRMHIAGDDIQVAVHDGDWDSAGKLLEEVKKIHRKIKNSFKK